MKRRLAFAAGIALALLAPGQAVARPAFGRTVNLSRAATCSPFVVNEKVVRHRCTQDGRTYQCIEPRTSCRPETVTMTAPKTHDSPADKGPGGTFGIQ